jgi:mannose-6-phosphate isomerase-like protein (cupin superfamily)
VEYAFTKMSIIKYLQLPFQFDAARMQAEVAALTDKYWKEHYNKKHYEGGWQILALRSFNGDPGNTFSSHTTVMQYADTPLLAACPCIQRVLAQLPGTKTSVRLMNLEAGAHIKEHTDQDISFEEGEARIHIPIQTNNRLAFFVEDEQIVMREGECWYLNLQLRHRVRNDGDTNRIHLVVDCLVDEAVKQLFNSDAVLQRKMIDAPTPAPVNLQDQLEIIQNLRLQNTPFTHQLADEMEKALTTNS